MDRCVYLISLFPRWRSPVPVTYDRETAGCPSKRLQDAEHRNRPRTPAWVWGRLSRSICPIVILSIALIPLSVMAQAIDEMLRDFRYAHEAAATTYHMCVTRVDWNFEYEETRTAAIVARLSESNIPKSDWNSRLLEYSDKELERDLYNYYKSHGIRFFKQVHEFGGGYILNATSGTYFDEEVDADLPRSIREFCDLAEKELMSGSAIGKYFKLRTRQEKVREFLTPWSEE